MARIFITGSADGLGMMAARLLVNEGHKVVLHARNEKRAGDALKAVPGAEAALSADLASIEETICLAKKVNEFGHFDAVIHNAAVGYLEGRITTKDGLPHVFAINSLAPYILTCLINKPQRLIYISSGLHRDGDTSLKDLTWKKRPWNGFNAYSDSKLHNVILAFAMARKWTDVYSNAMEPGWVATKMGGPLAPDNLAEAPVTQAWLAVSNDKAALVRGKYFYHQQLRPFCESANDVSKQELLLGEYERLSGVCPTLLSSKTDYLI
jgi:NAD(P)-dependent dehydrogenase (short-subunit alcohol dehydrogenase family)